MEFILKIECEKCKGLGFTARTDGMYQPIACQYCDGRGYKDENLRDFKKVLESRPNEKQAFDYGFRLGFVRACHVLSSNIKLVGLQGSNHLEEFYKMCQTGEWDEWIKHYDKQQQKGDNEDG